MSPCIEAAAFGLTFVAMAVLPWRWFYAFQIPDPPAYVDAIPGPLKLLIRAVALLVGVGALVVFVPGCV